MSISRLPKKYEVNKSKIILYLIMFSIISLIIIGLMIKTGIESNKLLSSYANINQMSFEIKSGEYRESMFFSIFLFFGVIVMFHICFFTKTKLIMNSKGIELYSIYSKKPSSTFYWNEIKSIQIGDVLTEGSKMPRYGMKIRYIKKSYSAHEQLKGFVPIMRLDNYVNLTENLEEIAKEVNIDIYHMDD